MLARYLIISLEGVAATITTPPAFPLRVLYCFQPRVLGIRLPDKVLTAESFLNSISNRPRHNILPGICEVQIFIYPVSTISHYHLRALKVFKTFADTSVTAYWLDINGGSVPHRPCLIPDILTCFCRKWIANRAGDNSSGSNDCVEEFHLIPMCCEALAP